MNSGAGLTQIGPATPTRAAHTLVTFFQSSFLYFVCLSTSKAKFVAASQAGQETLYLRETVKDFGYEQQNATEIKEDIWPLWP